MNGLKYMEAIFVNISNNVTVSEELMPTETKSMTPSMSPAQKFRSLWGRITDYLLAVMDNYPKHSPFRLTVYLLEGVLIGILFYLWLEYTQTERLFKTYYPVFVSFTIIFWHYLITEVCGRFLYRRKKPSNITIGKYWTISLIGVCFGYMMIYFNGQCPGIAEYYPDISLFYTSHISPTWVRLAVFYKIILIPWIVSTYLLTQGELKQQIINELASIKQINDSLDKKIRDGQSPANSVDRDGKNWGVFTVPLKDGDLIVNITDIYYITVEDHYCTLVFNKNGEPCKEYVRLSLKEALSNLPSSYFVQVHRSYAVNLQHVKHIKKEGQAYQLYIEGSDNFVSASRHRAHTFLPKLKKILN